MEEQFKAAVVWFILNGEAEKALKALALKHGVKVPSIEVGLPKKHRTKAIGCYSGRNTTISVLNSEILKNPFVVLHEYYHHLRTGEDSKHRGTEKYADAFASEYIAAYKLLTKHEKRLIGKTPDV